MALQFVQHLRHPILQSIAVHYTPSLRLHVHDVPGHILNMKSISIATFAMEEIGIFAYHAFDLVVDAFTGSASATQHGQNSNGLLPTANSRRMRRSLTCCPVTATCLPKHRSLVAQMEDVPSLTMTLIIVSRAVLSVQTV